MRMQVQRSACFGVGKIFPKVYKPLCGACRLRVVSMKSHSIIRLAVTSALLPACLAAHAQGNPDVLARIVDQGKNHSQIVDRFHYLCFDIGARLTSSPELFKAQNWALSQFKKFGCTNVHLEQWGTFPVGFDRGPLQVARMVEPFASDMEFTTQAWSNGTNGLVKGEVVKVPASVEEIRGHEQDFKGKWILMPPPGGVAPIPGSPGTVPVRPTTPSGPPGGPGGRRGGGGGGAAQASASPEVLAELDKVGVAGRISGSRNELVITSGPRWNSVTIDKHPGAVQVMVRRSDYERLARNLDYKRKVVVEIGAENRWFKGPVPQYNVVAEIKGSEKPNEVVIVSGHFDSWNGPLSQGAQDNGVGSMTAMEAARILCSAHAKPKRTIRFILWSGEEQGIFGSTNYVKQHKDELDKISAVLVDDGGGNYQGGYTVLAQMKPMMEQAMEASQKAFPELPITLTVSPGTKMPRGGGSDHAPFNAVGVPGFFTHETGKLDYTYVHHTQHDRFELCIPEYLIQSATNHAIVSYNLACADTMLPREPKPEASIQ